MGIFDFFKKDKAGMKIKKIKKVSDARAGDREILQMLRNHGDNAGISRPVRHYCYFATKEELNNFLDLPKIRQSQKEPLAQGIGMVIIINSTMNEEDIFAQIDEVTALTVRAGGKYDGWETSIEK
jgi:regulator of RNase E activity RraB